MPITAETVTAGQAFTVSVFYETSGFVASGTSFNSMDLFVGFDKSTTYGTGATPTDNRLSLANGDDPNTSVITDSTSSGLGEAFPGANALSGAAPDGSSGTVRPYGDDILLSQSPGATALTDVTTPTHLLDIMFDNENLAAGPETISIYNAGTGTDATTFLTNGTTEVRPNTVSLLLSQVGGTTATSPEPGALTLLTVGLGAMVGLLRRRR